MEILIFVVLGIISMLFKSKKPEDAPKAQKRQQTAQTDASDPMRKLKEMTQEMYKDIQREFQTEVDEPPSRQASERERKPVPVISVPSKAKEAESRVRVKEVPVRAEKSDRTSKREPHRGRLSAHQGTLVSKVPVKHTEMIPTSDQDLIKGIIFSEILGPPKSKQ
ncbi:hypothetical protein ABE073_03490 [Lederbergia citrisecunda]|uniref:hypothetical protein n=1 Tax=Lederbergia citrisecunda TaxID=2833583 RepID=UPI003D2A4ECA